MIEFDPDTHTYRVDGAVVPSVTQILAPLHDFAGIPADVLDNAADRGTAVHKATELYDLELLDEESLDDEVAAYLEGYRRFRADTGFEPERVETRVHSARYGYAGTLDRTGRLGRRKVLIDIKSGAQSPVTGPQTAAYQQALEEMTGAKVSRRYGLYLSPGDYRLVPYDERSDWHVFVSALSVFNFMRRHGHAA